MATEGRLKAFNFKKWIAENPEAQQPFDVKGYKLPGGAPTSPAVAANLPAFPALLLSLSPDRTDASM